MTERDREREREREDDIMLLRSQWGVPSSDRCTASQWDQTLPAGRRSAPSSWKSMKITSKPPVSVPSPPCVCSFTWMSTVQWHASHVKG